MAPAEYSSSCADSVSANPVGQALRVREYARRAARTTKERSRRRLLSYAGFLERKLISLDSASAAPSRSIEVGAYCTTRRGCALTRPWLTPPPHGVDRPGSPASPARRCAGYAWPGGDQGIPAAWIAVSTEGGVRADDPRWVDVRRQRRHRRRGRSAPRACSPTTPECSHAAGCCSTARARCS